MINFRGTKSGHVAFLVFLSLKPSYLTIETTQYKIKKRRAKRLLGRVKARRLVLMASKSRKVRINDGSVKCAGARERKAHTLADSGSRYQEDQNKKHPLDTILEYTINKQYLLFLSPLFVMYQIWV